MTQPVVCEMLLRRTFILPPAVYGLTGPPVFVDAVLGSQDRRRWRWCEISIDFIIE